MTYAEAEAQGVTIEEEVDVNEDYTHENAIEQDGVTFVDDDEFEKIKSDNDARVIKDEKKKAVKEHKRKLVDALLYGDVKRDGQAPTVENAVKNKEAEQAKGYAPTVQEAKRLDKDTSEYKNPEGQDFEIARQFADRTNELLGSFAGFLNTTLTNAEETDVGKAINKLGEKIGLAPSSSKNLENTENFFRENQELINSKPQHTWEELKYAVERDGVADIDTAQELLHFVVGQGIQSIPDMVGMVASLPAYMLARTEEMVNTRLENDGRKKGDETLDDYKYGFTGAVLSSALDRYGLGKLGGMLKGKTGVLAGIGAETGTEGLQEGLVEHVAETMGTAKEADGFAKVFDTDRAMAGMVGGAGVSTAVGGAGYAYNNPSMTMARELGNADIELSEDVITEQGLRTNLTPNDTGNVSSLATVKIGIRQKVAESLPNATDEEVEEVAVKVEQELQDELVPTIDENGNEVYDLGFNEEQTKLPDVVQEAGNKAQSKLEELSDDDLQAKIEETKETLKEFSEGELPYSQKKLEAQLKEQERRNAKQDDEVAIQEQTEINTNQDEKLEDDNEAALATNINTEDFGPELKDLLEGKTLNSSGLVDTKGTQDRFTIAEAHQVNAILASKDNKSKDIIQYQIEKSLDNYGHFDDDYDAITKEAKRIAKYPWQDIHEEINNSLRETSKDTDNNPILEVGEKANADMSYPDEWETTLMKTRWVARTLKDEGYLDADTMRKVWQDHDELLKVTRKAYFSKKEKESSKKKAPLTGRAKELQDAAQIEVGGSEDEKDQRVNDILNRPKSEEAKLKEMSTEERLRLEENNFFSNNSKHVIDRMYDFLSTDKKKIKGNQGSLDGLEPQGQNALFDTVDTESYITPDWAKDIVSDTTPYSDIIKAVTDAKNNVYSPTMDRVKDALAKAGYPHLKEDIAKYDELSSRMWDTDEPLSDLEESELDALAEVLEDYLDEKIDEGTGNERNAEETPNNEQGTQEVQADGKEGNAEGQSTGALQEVDETSKDEVASFYDDMGPEQRRAWLKDSDFILDADMFKKDTFSALKRSHQRMIKEAYTEEKKLGILDRDIEVVKATAPVIPETIKTPEYQRKIERTEDKPFGDLTLEDTKAAILVSNAKPEKVAEQKGQWIELPKSGHGERGRFGRITGEFEKKGYSIEVETLKSPYGSNLAWVNAFSVGTASVISKAEQETLNKWLSKNGYNDVLDTQSVDNQDILTTQKDEDETSGTTQQSSGDITQLNEQVGLKENVEGEVTSNLHEEQSESNDAGIEKSSSKEPDQATTIGSDGNSDSSSHTRRLEESPFLLEQEAAVSSGEKSRFTDNISAIEILKSKKKRYSIEDKKALARYTGFGGLQKAFSLNGKISKGWEKEVQLLENTLTPDELAAVRSGVLDAYYTPVEIVNSMWSLSTHLGFNGGLVLEPSMGTGRFIGLLPQENRHNTSFNGVELDPITFKIAAALYKVNGRNKGFQETNYGAIHDIVIGNPPYGAKTKIFDKNNKAYSKLNIHDYFVVKSLDSLKSGGVLNFVISSNFLDSMSITAKKIISSKAKLVGAIRLPNTAFSITGTKVVTDVVVFQKLEQGEEGNLEEWGDTTTLNEAKINKYFVNNPDMLLGTWKKGYRGGELSPRMSDLNEDIKAAINTFPKNIMAAPTTIEETTTTEGDTSVPPSVIYEKSKGNYYVNINEGEKTVPYLIKGKAEKIKSILGIRDTLNKVFNLQEDINSDPKELEKNRKYLNAQYESFVKKYGFLNKSTNRSTIVKDKSGYSILALEESYKSPISTKQGLAWGKIPREESANKADILTKRTIKPQQDVKTQNTKEALDLSLNRKGKVDLDYISKITDKSIDKVKKELVGEIYLDINHGFVTKEVYLSGDVKTKLDETSDEAAIKALKKVIPKDKTATEIVPTIGSSWIAPKYYKQYMKEHLGYRNPEIVLSSVTGKWTVPKETYSNNFPFSANVKNNDILSSALNTKKLVIRFKLGGKSMVHQEETELANAKVEELSEDFEAWVFSDKERREELTKTYNEVFTRFAPLDIKNKSDEYVIPNLSHYVPRQHQKKAVYKAVFGDSPLLFNHEVGSGKTLTSQMVAMEWRRLGKANKPLIVALKSTVEQYTKEFKEAYPNAKILLPSDSDFKTDNRKRFMSAIATGDYDAIVISHEQLTLLENPSQFQKELLEDEIQATEEAMQEAAQEKDRFTVRDLEVKIKSLEAKLEGLTNSNKDTDVLSFDKLGIDGLIVDEAHQFKKLAYSSSLGTIKGMPSQAGSLRAFDLYVKTQYLMTKNNNLVFMTGTPITNTIPELYLIQKFLQPETLKEQGLYNFDAWANSNMNVETDIEISPTGTFQEVTRVKSFNNLDTLIDTTSQIIDTVTNADIIASDKNFKLPKLKDGKPEMVFIERSKDQEKYIQTLSDRLAVVNDKENDDNHLVIYGDAAKASIDMRLISNIYKDDPKSKLNKVVDSVLEKYKSTNKLKGTQLIFSDIGTPKGGGKAKIELMKLMDLAEGKKGTAAEQEDAQKMLLDDYSDAEIEDILHGTEFSVYDDIKEKLVRGGVPESEVVFIHDFKNKEQKIALSEKVNSGEIRIVIGSTKKLGTGMNVQKRLTKVHHVDIPYMPSDLQQRNGRIIRQGNDLYNADENFKIEIAYYATKETLDTVKWQILENKARFIKQFFDKAGNIDSDTGEQSNAELAETMKALASGNPLLVDKAKADKLAKKLRSLERGFIINKSMNEDDMNSLENNIKKAPARIAKIQADAEQVKNNNIKINGKSFKKPIDMSKALYKEIVKYIEGKGIHPKTVGSIGDIDIKISYDQQYKTVDIVLEGQAIHKVITEYLKLKEDGIGQRVENELKRIQGYADSTSNMLEQNKEKLEGLKSRANKPFNKQKELDAATADIERIKNEMEKQAKNKNKPSEDSKEEEKTHAFKSPNKKSAKHLDKAIEEEGAMPNNPPMIMQQLEEGKKEVLKGYKIDISDNSFILDGNKIHYTEDFRKPMTMKFLRSQIESLIGSTIYFGRIQGNNVGGLYRDNNNELRVRSYSNVEVLAHELGHFLKNYTGVPIEKLIDDNVQEVESFSYDKEPDTLKDEGWAEFFRAYLTNNSHALEFAPNFHKAFEEALKQDKALYRKVKDFQETSHKWFAQGSLARLEGMQEGNKPKGTGLQELAAKVGDKTRITGLVTKAKELYEASDIDFLRLSMMDKTHGFDVAERFLTGGKLNRKSISPTTLLRNAIGGAASTFEQVATTGMIEKDGDGFKFKEGSKSLKQVFQKSIDEDTMKELMSYFLARNAVQLKGQGKKSGIDGASDIVDYFERTNPDFVSTFNDYQKFNDEMLDFYVDMNHITKDMKKQFKKSNPIYVPTHRVMESMNAKSGVSSGRFMRKSKTGSDRIYKDVLANITTQLNAHISEAMISNAKSEMFAAIRAASNGSRIAARISKSVYMNKVDVSQQANKILGFLEEQGKTIDFVFPKKDISEDESYDATTKEEEQQVVLPEIEIVDIETANKDMENGERVALLSEILKEQPHMTSFFMFGMPPVKIADSEVVSVIVNGKEEYFELGRSKEAALLALSLDNIKPPDLGKGVESLRGMKNLMTKTITTLPPFKLGNVIRDTFETIAFRDKERGSSRNLFKYMKFYKRAAKSITTHDKFYKLYLLNGGGFSVFSEADSQQNVMGVLSNTSNLLTKLWETYNVDEYVNRVAVAMEAVDSGASMQQAVGYGRDITLDFQMGGTNTANNIAYALIPFYRASMNGAYKLVRELEREGKGSKNYLKAFAKLSVTSGAYLTLVSAMAYFSMFLGSDDDIEKNKRAYNALTDDEKARFIYFWSGGEAIRLPIPHAIGFIYMKIPEYILDTMLADTPKEVTAEALKFALANQILPDFPLIGNAGILQPYLDLMINKDFKGMEIEPSWSKRESKQLDDRFTDYTREGYKALADTWFGKNILMGNIMGQTPISFEYHMKAKFGYYEKLIGEPMDYIARNEKLIGKAEKTPTDIAKDFFLHNLFYNADDNGRSSWGVAFMKHAQEAEEYAGSLKFREKQISKTKDKTRLEDLLGEEKVNEMLEIHGISEGVREEVSGYRKGRGAELSSNTNSAKNKKKLKREYNRKIEEAYRKGYKSIIEIEKKYKLKRKK